MSLPDPLPHKRLRLPLHAVPWLGPAAAELLARLGLRRVRELLFYFPKHYEPVAQFATVADIQEQVPVRLNGKLVDIEFRQTRNGRTILGALFQESTGSYFRAVWFNMPFVRQNLTRDEQYLVSGKPRLQGQRWEIVHPRLTLLDSEEAAIGPPTGPLPVYGLTEGITQGRMRSWIKRLVTQVVSEVEEPLPAEFRYAHGLIHIHDAVQGIHFPADEAQLEQARNRLVYQELLVLQTALALRRAAVATQDAIPLPCDARVDARIRRRIPFILSPDQEQAIEELKADLEKSRPMQRMLLGDVGTGKTLVAAYGLLLAVANGGQGALMVPTEILARQQYETLTKLLKDSPIQVALLVGGQKSSEREQTLVGLANGTIQLVVGTQAVIQESVKFHRLALVVIDEQHRFGVRERAALKQNQFAPHYLVMTATPIPRTVMLTACGDLDVSTLKSRPGRVKEVSTHLVEPERQAEWWEFVRKKLREGRQAYIVAPLVDASEHIEASSVEELFESLTQTELAGFNVGLVHGRQSTLINQAAMDAFRANKLHALVCTSVIEVGLDVPNATTITIYNPERFGLAQLHQLRGRVGRGLYRGFCGCLVSETNTTNQERMEAFAKLSSGFDLAEMDFKLRGPGSVLGTQQSGIPPLAIADLERDRDLLESTRDAAKQLVGQIHQSEWSTLLAIVKKRHGHGMLLGDVG